MAVHPDDESEGHIDDDSAHPTKQENVVIKYNNNTTELCRKCRGKVVYGVKCSKCTGRYHWKCGGIKEYEVIRKNKRECAFCCAPEKKCSPIDKEIEQLRQPMVEIGKPLTS